MYFFTPPSSASLVLFLVKINAEQFVERENHLAEEGEEREFADRIAQDGEIGKAAVDDHDGENQKGGGELRSAPGGQVKDLLILLDKGLLVQRLLILCKLCSMLFNKEWL